ncbi:MAG: GntR family transcriptional regulator [Saprospiraceae bacterium]|nr:GntR family transcriptional regulator [Bacteroidia bacterium]NNL93455.1 GntR family transcriptional regulator [Saprospiraceae bacterium]
MIALGKTQQLKIHREMPQGFYLIEEGGDEEVLLPQRFISDDMEIGDLIDVFVYCDSNDRDMASTEIPLLEVDEFAYLKVTNVNEIGAFCDWGTSKELLIPFRNQSRPLKEGYYYIVHMFLDEVSDRLVGSTKLKNFLEHESDGSLEMGQEVDLLVYGSIDIGYKVIINNTFAGLVYKNESHINLQIGQRTKGYLKPIREDGKIDVSLTPIGHKSIEGNEQVVMDKLVAAGGMLPFSDKSDPEKIRKYFGFSKKLFKKVIGGLYKKKLIKIEKESIHKI